MEPDCTFYVGERADGYQAGLVEGEAAADAFLASTAPDLVVEVELTHADADKVERYDQMGVRELWRPHGRKGSRELRTDFPAFRSEGAPRPLDASRVLEGLTPADVCEAVDGVRSSRIRAERTEAVARILRRRGTVRVREEEAPYAPSAGVLSTAVGGSRANRTAPAASKRAEKLVMDTDQARTWKTRPRGTPRDRNP